MHPDNQAEWRVVAAFSQPSTTEDRFLDELDRRLRDAGVVCLRLELRHGRRALATSLNALRSAPECGIVVAGVQAPPPDRTAHAVVFLSAADDERVLKALLLCLQDAPDNIGRPGWAGVTGSAAAVRAAGASEPEGTVTLKDGPIPATAAIYRLPPPAEFLKQTLSEEALTKIPEDPDNLKRRSEWFRRRTGPRR